DLLIEGVVDLAGEAGLGPGRRDLRLDLPDHILPGPVARPQRVLQLRRQLFPNPHVRTSRKTSRKLFTRQQRNGTVSFGNPSAPACFALRAFVKRFTNSKETEVLTQITTDWRDLAACRDSEPGLFFPVGTTGPAVEQIEAAIAICMSCSVREECLQYALETNQESGVWGGYAEDDRRRLRKRWLAERRRRTV